MLKIWYPFHLLELDELCKYHQLPTSSYTKLDSNYMYLYWILWSIIQIHNQPITSDVYCPNSLQYCITDLIWLRYNAHLPIVYSKCLIVSFCYASAYQANVVSRQVYCILPQCKPWLDETTCNLMSCLQAYINTEHLKQIKLRSLFKHNKLSSRHYQRENLTWPIAKFLK